MVALGGRADLSRPRTHLVIRDHGGQPAFCQWGRIRQCPFFLSNLLPQREDTLFAGGCRECVGRSGIQGLYLGFSRGFDRRFSSNPLHHRHAFQIWVPIVLVDHRNHFRWGRGIGRLCRLAPRKTDGRRDFHGCGRTFGRWFALADSASTPTWPLRSEGNPNMVVAPYLILGTLHQSRNKTFLPVFPDTVRTCKIQVPIAHSEGSKSMACAPGPNFPRF